MVGLKAPANVELSIAMFGLFGIVLRFDFLIIVPTFPWAQMKITLISSFQNIDTADPLDLAQGIIFFTRHN